MDNFHFDATLSLPPDDLFADHPEHGTPMIMGFGDKAKVAGWIKAKIIRKDGRVEEVGLSKNGITNEGYNNMLGVHFHGDTQQTAWYIGLIGNTSFSTLAAADTMASHSGWTESVAYSNATRPQWTCGAAASKSITNSVVVSFNINADSTVLKGIFIPSDNTKSGTSGKLWSTGLFSSDQTMNNGDVLQITYTVNLS